VVGFLLTPASRASSRAGDCVELLRAAAAALWSPHGWVTVE
jgi:hypothetical protein